MGTLPEIKKIQLPLALEGATWGGGMCVIPLPSV